MYSLFIDTHAKNVLIILFKDGKIVEKNDIETMNKHSVVTMPSIKQILDNNKCDVKDLSEILVCNGPGSFTGSRIAVTIAKTIAYSLNIPIKQVDALTIMAINVDKENKTITYGEIDYYTGDFFVDYDNSYKTYYEKLRYENWKRQMDEIINNPNTSHKARRKRISAAILWFNILKFKIRTRICKLHVTVNEDLRVLLSLSRLK